MEHKGQCSLLSQLGRTVKDRCKEACCVKLSDAWFRDRSSVRQTGNLGGAPQPQPVPSTFSH